MVGDVSKNDSTLINTSVASRKRGFREKDVFVYDTLNVTHCLGEKVNCFRKHSPSPAFF